MDIGSVLKDDGGAWYTVPGSEAEINIVRLKPKQVREFTKQATITKFDGMSVKEKLDDKTLNALLLDAAVRGWRKIEEGGKPLDCTLANKQRLDENWSEFSRLWQAVLAGSSEVNSLRQQEQEKN